MLNNPSDCNRCSSLVVLMEVVLKQRSVVKVLNIYPRKGKYSDRFTRCVLVGSWCVVVLVVDGVVELMCVAW